MKNIKNQSGFTLIELILVITILGILAVAVAPQFVNIQAEAQEAQRDGVAGSIRDGINMQFALTLAQTGVGTFPAAISTAPGAACAGGCFDLVLQSPVLTAWTYAAGAAQGDYTHTATGTTYTYTSADGTFE